MTHQRLGLCARCRNVLSQHRCVVCESEGHDITWYRQELLFRRMDIGVLNLTGRTRGGRLVLGRGYSLPQAPYLSTVTRRARCIAELNDGVLAPDSIAFPKDNILWIQAHSDLPSVLEARGMAWSAKDVLGFARDLFGLVGAMQDVNLVHGGLDAESVRVSYASGRPRPVITDIPPVVVGGWSAHAAPEIQLGEEVSGASDMFGAAYVVGSLAVGATLDGLGRHHSWLSGQPGPVAVQLPPARSFLAELLTPLLDRDPGARPANPYAVSGEFARAMGHVG